MEWHFKTTPAADALLGVYAVLLMWDSAEGAFPDAATWYGTHWALAPKQQVIACAGPFCSDREALDWAYANDPDL